MFPPAQIHQVLEQIRVSIDSKTDEDVITQIKNLPITLQDGQKEILEEFRNFAEKMTENNQDALIKALESVIQDFNQNLTEQFGENFKQLNKAVENLLEWQENYRQHIETVEQQIQLATAGTSSTGDALTAIQEQAQNTPKMISPLSTVLEMIAEQTQVLHDHLSAVAGIREQALEAFPVIENNLHDLTTSFSEHVHAVGRAFSKDTRRRGRSAHGVLRESYRSLAQDTTITRDSFAQELTKTLAEMSKQADEEFRRHHQFVEFAIKESEKMNGQFEAFDQEMQKELTRSLEVLGQNLASVSEKFVEEYTPLTQQLQKLLNVAKSNGSGY